MKKVIALIMVVAMLAVFAGCGKKETSESTTAAATDADNTTAAQDTTAADDAADEDTYVVGICQLVQHPALDAATAGFQKALTEELGDKVTFELQNASGETPNCATIINGFVSSNVDLILANATAPLQAAASATADIPVLGTSVTDYATALEIDNWTGTVGTNVSGTSDLAPLDQQAAMVKELFPNAKTVGLLYCSAEANSQYQVDVMTKELEALGYTCTAYSFTDTNDVASVAQAACQSDVIFIPTDNTAASNTEAIANVVLAEGVPVVASEAGICAGCGVATLSISYEDLGYSTGKMAAKILKGEAKVSEMPVEFASKAEKMYNEANCKALGIEIPEGYSPLK